MTTPSVARISALVAKEIAELRAAKGVLLGPLAMLATAVVMPVAIAVGVPAWSGEGLGAAEELARLVQQFPRPDTPGLSSEARAQILLLHQFLPLMALVPVVGAMTLVTTSVIGEKQARTIEPLLATPTTTAELLMAKTGTAFGVAIASLVAGYGLFLGLVAATALPGVAASLVSARSLALVTAVAPAAALVALTLGAIVSTRAKDARSAQQAGVIVVVPIVAAFVAQLNGRLSLDTGDLVVAALVLLAIAAALGAVAVRAFDRERILTRWT